MDRREGKIAESGVCNEKSINMSAFFRRSFTLALPNGIGPIVAVAACYLCLCCVPKRRIIPLDMVVCPVRLKWEPNSPKQNPKCTNNNAFKIKKLRRTRQNVFGECFASRCVCVSEFGVRNILFIG